MSSRDIFDLDAEILEITLAERTTPAKVANSAKVQTQQDFPVANELLNHAKPGTCEEQQLGALANFSRGLAAQEPRHFGTLARLAGLATPDGENEVSGDRHYSQYLLDFITKASQSQTCHELEGVLTAFSSMPWTLMERAEFSSAYTPHALRLIERENVDKWPVLERLGMLCWNPFDKRGPLE
jgi:hypothetical protein